MSQAPLACQDVGARNAMGTPREIASAEEFSQHVALPRGRWHESEDLLRLHGVALAEEAAIDDAETVREPAVEHDGEAMNEFNEVT